MSALAQGRRRDRYYGLGYVTDALLHLPFEGGKPYETDFSIDTNGHLGQKATISGGVIGRPGKFGKAVQVAEAVTNMVLNPVGGGASSIAAIGAASITTQSTDKKYIWSTSTKLVTTAAANDGVDYTLSALTNAIHYVTIRIDAVWTTQEWSLDGTTYNAPTLLSSDGDGWYVYGFQFPAAQANGSTSLKIRQTDATIRTVYIGHVQAEAKAYPTPPCHGSLGDGHSWSGTAHNSTSSRTAASLGYNAKEVLNPYKGSVVCWVPTRLLTERNDYSTLYYLYMPNYWLHFHSSGMQLRAVANGGDTGYSSYAAALRDKEWSCLIHTWDISENRQAIYVNGILITSGTVGQSTPTFGSYPLYIGLQGNANTYHINTVMDDFAILDRALTADEVAQIYTNDTPLVVPGRYGLVDINTAQTVGGVKTFSDQMGIGGTPDTNAILDLQSTSKPFMPPRMTTIQRDAVASPAAGMVIFNTTTGVLNFYNGATWGAV